MSGLTGRSAAGGGHESVEAQEPPVISKRPETLL